MTKPVFEQVFSCDPEGHCEDADGMTVMNRMAKRNADSAERIEVTVLANQARIRHCLEKAEPTLVEELETPLPPVDPDQPLIIAGPVEAVVTRPRERGDGDDYLRRIGPHAPDGEH